LVSLNNPLDVWIVRELVAWQYYNKSEGNKCWKAILEESPERIEEFVNLLQKIWLSEIKPKVK
jgi:hypothetical protein